MNLSRYRGPYLQKTLLFILVDRISKGALGYVWPPESIEKPIINVRMYKRIEG